MIFILANEAVGAAETRHGEWSVIRLRPAAHGTACIESLSLGVGPRGGLGEQGDSVSRQLVLTNTSLVERRPENYEVDIFSFLFLYKSFTLKLLIAYAHAASILPLANQLSINSSLEYKV